MALCDCFDNGHDVIVVEADLLQGALVCSLVVIRENWQQVLQLVENSHEFLTLPIVVSAFKLSKQVLLSAH